MALRLHDPRLRTAPARRLQDQDRSLARRKRAREDLLSGARRFAFRDGYAEYMAATRMKDRGRDAYEHVWKRIEPQLGHLLHRGGQHVGARCFQAEAARSPRAEVDQSASDSHTRNA